MNEDNKKEDKTQLIIGIVFGLIALVAFYKYFIGNTTIGSWFEKSKDYTTYYYVNVFPSDHTKNYRLKAEISRESCGEGCGRATLVTRAFFPNGGYLDFDNCDVEFDKQTQCLDQDSNFWDVELTRIKYTN